MLTFTSYPVQVVLFELSCPSCHCSGHPVLLVLSRLTCPGLSVRSTSLYIYIYLNILFYFCMHKTFLFNLHRKNIFLLYRIHTYYLLKTSRACMSLSMKETLYLEYRLFIHGSESPSLLVPCSKPTAPFETPLYLLPSPPPPPIASSCQHDIYLHTKCRQHKHARFIFCRAHLSSSKVLHNSSKILEKSQLSIYLYDHCFLCRKRVPFELYSISDWLFTSPVVIYRFFSVQAVVRIRLDES